MCYNFFRETLKSSFIRKLSFGFVVSSLLIAAIAFLCEYFTYFGWFATLTGRISFLGLFSVVFGLLFGYVFGLYITRNIKNLMNATSVISKGDLRHKIEVMSDDEMGILTRTFNSMVDSLVEMVKEVTTVSDTIHDSALNLSAASEQMNASTKNISGTVESIAGEAKMQADMGAQTHRITEALASSIHEVAEKADAANRLAEQVFVKAQEGNQHTLEAAARITNAAAKIENASRLVHGFRERTLGINNAVLHITSIAQQTHLLALNATIEAARAGENGRGFGVVADEVRKLSHETKKLAGQISELAETINRESQEVLVTMSDSNATAAQSKEVVHSASRALQEIVSDVQYSLNQVQEITRLTRDQAMSASKVVAALREIADIAERNAAGTGQAYAAAQEQTSAMQAMAASAQDLSMTSDRLKSCIAAFRY